MDGYRIPIYANYASCFQGNEGSFDAQASRKWGRAYRSYLRRWLPSDPAARILDAGCGGGRMLHFLGERGYTSVAGVDCSLGQVELARQINPRVQQGDAIAYLKDKDAEFDFIISLDVIEHLRKDEVLEFLRLAHRAMKPGGRLVLQTPNGASPFVGNVLYGDFTHETAFSPGGLDRVLRLCGFEKVETREARPVAHGLFSAVRLALWMLTRTGIVAYNLIETGHPGDSIYTRVFLISAVKA